MGVYKMNETMDRYYGYRNLLAAEEHISELLMGPESSEEASFLRGTLNEIRYLRDDFVPEEKNKRYHCLVKHLSAAYEAALEVSKATQEELDDIRAKALRSLLYSVLEKCLDRKIIICERCGVKEEDATRGIQDEGAGSASEASDDGLAGGSLQGSSFHRSDVVFGREASDYPGDETLGIERAASDEEDGAPF